MRIPRTRGAVSGLLLVILGIWGAIVPFIGSYFNVSFFNDATWQWSAGRFWLSVLPGVVAVIGGLWLMSSAHRASASVGAWLGIAAGVWFIVGNTVSRLWTADGLSAVGPPLGGTSRQVLELLVSYYALGAAITGFAAFALGRLAVRSVRDAELAREADLERERQARARREGAAAPAAAGAGVGAGAAAGTARRGDDRIAREEPVAAGRDEPAAGRDERIVRDEPAAGRDERIVRTQPVGEPPTRVSSTGGPGASAGTAPERAGARTDVSPEYRPGATGRGRSGGLLDRFRRR